MADEELNRKFVEISRILADVAVSHQKAEQRMRGVDENMTRVSENMRAMDENMTRVGETVRGMGENMTRMDERMVRTDERMRSMDESMRRSDRRMARAERILVLTIRAGRRERREWRERYAALVDAQMRTEAKLDRLAVAQANLAETQAHSDRRLDALIDIVREDRERKNGRPRREDASDEGVNGKG